MERKYELNAQYPSNSQVAGRSAVLIVAFVIIITALLYNRWLYTDADSDAGQSESFASQSTKSFDELDKNLKKYTY
jgi:hypothetical protein